MTRQRGFGAIAAIVILVILAVLAAGIVSISTTQQMTSAQDVMSARAWQAARAGNEWGLYQALKGPSCVGSPGTTLDLSVASGFHVTVVCDRFPSNEGQTCTTLPCVPTVVTVYRIKAVACPAAQCPSTDASVVTGAGYIERTRVVIATDK